ncbi:RagB/SusD family nutrient uptake outer membrane protein [Cesiribacter sp. SM1]|uniref:RagB/SusD family nutrient uptake outer membrane protein n=1 Tax=Cesiribacter sp. SM1 TaxID=2861196 RepID=UPI001CD266FD|nr:RagB/SusD family nutrient uptake outer membrane protein [Cesiribacter sp. SM1]
MKRYIALTALFALSASLFSSCEDLTEEPVALLAPEGFYKSPADVLTGLNGAYSAIGSEEFWGRKLTLSLLLRGDMADIGDLTTTTPRIQVNGFQMDPSNGMVAAFWPRAYEGLATINSAIEGAQKLNEEEDSINPLIAEGRFLRAFLHFHLVQLFGDIPYMGSSLIDPNLAYTLDETPVAEVYAGIIADLEFAKQWLPNDQGVRSRPSKATAAGLLASVHLTRENWQGAYDEARYVIDNREGFGIGLAAEFQNLFDASVIDNPENAKEILFTVDFRGKDESNISGYGNYTRDYLASVTGPRGDERFAVGEGWSIAVPTMKVYESWDPKDYRKAVSFDTVAMMGDTLTRYVYWDRASRGVARPHIAKYYRAFGQAGLNGRDSDINAHAQRYAEILLIAAEALNELSGPTDEAMSYVNEVRSRARRELDADPANDRSFPVDVPTGLSKEDFRWLVLEERRLELAFEFKRWYDIVRRDLGNRVFSPEGLEYQPNFNAARDYLFPKPQSDLNLNPNLDQNTGY